jgi:Caspase domain
MTTSLVKGFCRYFSTGTILLSQMIGLEIAPRHALASPPQFLVVGGGSSPCNNEIALEKNVLYFQRTLKELGNQPQVATYLFANGNQSQTTVRYLDPQGLEQYKSPEIPYLKGAATLDNISNWFNQFITQKKSNSIFFYYTGHGGENEKNSDNNYASLWQNSSFTVKGLAKLLDPLPPQTTFVAVMTQCYGGSFANFIYQDANPRKKLAPQNRCGFFATIKSQPSVGCTPLVNESDYRDYSSSFFAGLSGRDRVGKSVSSADFDKDGRVSYREAHAFAKVDEKTPDLPISTSEAWLQRYESDKDRDILSEKPIAEILTSARPEQYYVVESLTKFLNFKLPQNLLENATNQTKSDLIDPQRNVYFRRLVMELKNIHLEQKVRKTGDKEEINNLDRVLKCESGSLN